MNIQTDIGSAAIAPKLKRTQSALSRPLHFIRNLVLPPVCLACDSVLVERGAVCPQCWRQLRFIERPWCDVLGAPFSYDLGEKAQSAAAIANPPKFDRARSVVLYDDVARRLVQGLKFSDRTDLAPWLAEAMANFVARSEPDMIADNPLILPVPLHKRRLLSRRFNQSAEIARHFARLTHTRYAFELLQRVRPTRQQVGLGAREREKNVRGAFRVPAGSAPMVSGSHIILIDDVFTTGATLDACARALRRAGALRIDCLTYARVATGDL